MHKNDTMPKRIDQTILLCDKHERETRRNTSARVDPTENGVACVQPGKEQPGVAMAQPQGGPIMGKNGKKVVCWNPACNGANHLLRDCPKADKAQRKAMAEKEHYDFVEVKSADILADRTSGWEGFTSFVTWSTGAIIVVLALMAVFLV